MEPPPRLPYSEGKIGPIGRIVIGGCGADQPVYFRIWQGPSSKVVGFNCNRSRVAHKVGALSLVASHHFEFGPAELLNLEAVCVKTARYADFRVHFNARITQVCILW